MTSPRNESECDAFTHAIAWPGSFSVLMNVLLFIVRADAVFLRNSRYRIIFGFLWLATLASFLIPFSVTGASVPVVHRCSIEMVKYTAAIGIAAVSAVDTALFLGITARILNWYNPQQFQVNLFSQCGRISRILLLTGQLYYLYVYFSTSDCEISSHKNTYSSPVVTLNIFSMIVLLIRSIPPDYQAVALLLSVAFQNMMTCRVFVLLYLGALRDDLFLSVN